ncbi:MAG: Redoxin domain protein [Proteobacteria bacterium]|nr:Redoxin domain protein [Pseudomonadota bacterium]
MFRHLTLGLLFGLLLGTTSHAIETGSPVPPLEISTFDGKLLNTSSLRGEVVILNIWAIWCTYCRTEMPALETYYRRHRHEGLRIIAVSIDDESAEAKAREIMNAYSFTGGVGRLSKLSALGNLSRLPLTFVIDRNGILRKNGYEGDPKIDLPPPGKTCNATPERQLRWQTLAIKKASIDHAGRESTMAVADDLVNRVHQMPVEAR